MNYQNICPICLENAELPVTINFSKDKKCPFISKNLLCLRCVHRIISKKKYDKYINCERCLSTNLFTYHYCNSCGLKLNKKKIIKCICNSHKIDISNIEYMCYGDYNHTSDDFVEKKLWNDLYFTNTKCNNCKRNFKNIKQLYEHYKYYGDYCFPLNKYKIILICSILLLYLFIFIILNYYKNNCTIYIDNIYQRYCIEDCQDKICNYLYQNYKQINVSFLVIYNLSINILIQNISNFFKEQKIIWKFKGQLYSIFVLCYFLTLLYIERKKLNDFLLYSLTQLIIEISLQIRILWLSYNMI